MNEPQYTLTQIRAALGLSTNAPTTQELREEEFKNKCRVHDWRNYAASYRWKKMTDLERLFDFVSACRDADAEEWD